MKTGFKKFVTSTVLGASLLGAAPRESKATMMILTGSGLDWQQVGNIAGEYPGNTFFFILLCVGLLPVCLLDQQGSNNIQGVSDNYLLENGYSLSEVKTIKADQLKLTNSLLKAKKKIAITKEDTAFSIQSQIKSVVPDVSQTYLQFVTDFSAL